MSSRDWIPAKDADLDPFALNFGAVITSSAAAFGLTGGQASAFVSLQTAFADDQQQLEFFQTVRPRSS